MGEGETIAGKRMRSLRILFVAVLVAAGLSLSMTAMPQQAEAAGPLGGGSSAQVTSGNRNSFDSIIFNGKTVNAIYPVGYKPSGGDTTYCCAAFVKKFYQSIWGVNVWNLIYPNVPTAARGYFSKTNNPVVGDIVAAPNHWAIVKSVSGNTVTVIEQNWSWMHRGALWATKGRTCNKNGSGTTFYHWSQYSSTSPKQTVATPSISTTDVIGGKQVNIKTSTSGATIRYTTDGKTNPTSSNGNVFSKSFLDTWQTMGVRAIAYKSGMNNSSVVGKTISTSQVSTPAIVVSDTPTGAVARITSTSGATIYYTTDGTVPSTSNGKKYTSEVKLTSNATVKAFAVKAGMRNSSVSSKDVICSAPAKPAASVDKARIAVNDSTQVTWKKDSSAASYTATLYRGEEKVDSFTTEGTVASFALSETGDYEIAVKATNYYGDSEESDHVSVSAMPDCTVRFVDEHEEDSAIGVEVLNEQTVRYGYGATKPASPAKRGYSFAGWEGSLSNITSDTQIVATWDINKYVIQFYSADGSTCLKRQIVQYQASANPPDEPAPNTGYVFSGWQVVSADDDSARDYTKVDSNMKLRAVFSWADNELPNVAQITDATRTATGIYAVKVKLTNYPYDTTTALLRVALKTSNDKLVQTARETVSISKDSTIEKTVVLKYTGNNIATVAEAEVIALDGNYRTGGACSKAATATIKTGDGFSYSAWSDWSTTEPTSSDTVQVEKATQYRYRDKQTTTSTATSLAGWTRDGKSTTTYGAWSGEKSTTSKPTTSDTLTIASQSTKYNYYHWHSKYDNCMNQDSCWVNGTSVKHTVSTTSPLSGPKYVFADKGGKASKEYGPYGTCSWKPSKAYWWLESTVTTYKYKTRTKTVNYGYYKWDDNSWSDWSNEQAAASDSRQVETRTVWRYRTKQNTAGVEDTSGKSYEVSGKLDVASDLAGKEATVMVYNVTNTDPNEDQMQYIGQTVIGTGNSYDFSFTPKSDPTAESGDYIVALGIKGATGLVNVDTIKAPKAKYKIEFQYKVDGMSEAAVVSSQEVSEGENAEIPDLPQCEGYRFVGWSDSAQRVYSDMTVSALFVPETYSVAWVNWATEDVYLQTCSYGDKLEAPAEIDEVEGMTFKGWDALSAGKTTVTENMVVNAVYEPVTYTVAFMDGAGNTVSEQRVKYGESADLPATNPTQSGKVFMGWDTSADAPWWKVKGDMVVNPLFACEETASAPIATLPENTGYVGPRGEKVFLTTSTENAEIYYTVDGSEPSVPVPSSKGEPTENTSALYDAMQGIDITNPTTVRAIAVKGGANDSCIMTTEIDITATNDVSYAQCAVGDSVVLSDEPAEPGVSVWLGDTILEPNVDYTVSYLNNDEVGEASACIQGIGEYEGSQVITFNIISIQDAEKMNPESIDAATVSIANKAYTGKALKPVPTVKLNGVTLKLGVDYTVKYSNNIKVGTAQVAITGTGNYTGTVTKTFKITKANNPITLKAKSPAVAYSKTKDQTIALSNALTVTKAQGKVTYKKTSGNAKITVASNGKITVKKGLAAGTYKVTISATAAGNSNYKAGTKTVAVNIKVKGASSLRAASL